MKLEMVDTPTEEKREKSTPQTEIIDTLLADLRWWGNAIAGNGPVGGYARAAKDAENHWYTVTLPMLYTLNAVYAYQVPNLTADLRDARKHLKAYLPLVDGNQETK